MKLSLRSRRAAPVPVAASTVCDPIGVQRDREVVTVHGTITDITIRPMGNSAALEARVDDGTGVVTLLWLGQRRITGIEVGRSLTAEGRIGLRGTTRVIHNPRYWLD